MLDKQTILKNLADKAIERLKKLPPPVVRVSGPITSGGYGYQKNLERFIKAQEMLRRQGYTVFDYFEGHNDEEVIKDLNLPWEEVMCYYHQPILASSLIKTAFLLPHWQESNGAKWEHEYFVKNGIEVVELSENDLK